MGSEMCIRDRSPIVFGSADAVSSAKGSHKMDAQAGFHLSPQVLSGGEDVWNELGDGFTLINLNGSDSEPWEHAANALAIPLKSVSDHSDKLRNAWKADLLLVRPDQFVAWTGKTSENAERVLAKVVGRKTS